MSHYYSLNSYSIWNAIHKANLRVFKFTLRLADFMLRKNNIVSSIYLCFKMYFRCFMCSDLHHITLTNLSLIFTNSSNIPLPNWQSSNSIIAVICILMHSIICSLDDSFCLKHVIFHKFVLHAVFSYRCHPHITAWILVSLNDIHYLGTETFYHKRLPQPPELYTTIFFIVRILLREYT